ncbi:hypothetical protein BDZ94DRAFT_1267723 [Collybia nuda]|uniref:Uncharacterized protein n=1 Tax=Collybia nuda TaxID=64659 RepID=A0A9P5XZ03_9AGAR|nr:hypothetical protein BDZ94DRAFT_1267723 [Collybia nuda]
MLFSLDRLLLGLALIAKRRTRNTARSFGLRPQDPIVGEGVKGRCFGRCRGEWARDPDLYGARHLTEGPPSFSALRGPWSSGHVTRFRLLFCWCRSIVFFFGILLTFVVSCIDRQ